MARKQKLADAKIDFKKMKFDKKKNFFEISSKEKDLLMSLLEITQYSKPKNAPGSKLRAFYEALTR